MKSNSKPNAETLTLKCRLCGRVYCVGEDATITTDENVRASVGVAIVFTGPSLPARKDLVGPFYDNWGEKRRESEKRGSLNTLRMVRDTVKRGQQRYWYCERCNNYNAPFEYPPF